MRHRFFMVVSQLQEKGIPGHVLQRNFAKTASITIFVVDKRKDQYDNFISQRKSKSKSIKSKVKND